MMVTEQRLERVVGCAKRSRGESTDVALQWRVLESGVLAVKTPLEVVTTDGKRCIWFEPRKKRLVCPRHLCEFSNLNSDSIQNKLSFNGVFYEKKTSIPSKPK